MRFAFFPETPPPYLTIWYQNLLAAFASQAEWVPQLSEASLIIPTFDVAGEMNWPFFGQMDKAFLRGCAADYFRMVRPLIRKLLDSTQEGQVILIIDMNPSSQLRAVFKHEKRLLFGAASAPVTELRRAWDFGFPASPIVSADVMTTRKKRDLLVSFLGFNSHPVRQRIASFHNGKDVIVYVSATRSHLARISPLTTRTDPLVRDFIDLIEHSTFSLVPRGDALFSYRLLEVMRGGSIPVILSDGWALPFADLIDWQRCAVIWPERKAATLLPFLRSLPETQVQSMRDTATNIYLNYFASLELQVRATLSLVSRNLAAGFPSKRPIQEDLLFKLRQLLKGALGLRAG